MKNNPSGMTLLELLIVIAVIGVLASVLIPNLLSARNRSIDVAAQAYLRESITMQEMYWLDNSAYTATLTDLNSLGLKSVPAGVTFTVVAASNTGYCMTSERTNGSGKIFHATLQGGLGNSFSSTVCTTAQ